MMDYLAEKTGNGSMADAARLIEDSVQRGFAEQRIRPMEFGGDMGTTAVTRELIALVGEREARRAVNA